MEIVLFRKEQLPSRPRKDTFEEEKIQFDLGFYLPGCLKINALSLIWDRNLEILWLYMVRNALRLLQWWFDIETDTFSIYDSISDITALNRAAHK